MKLQARVRRRRRNRWLTAGAWAALVLAAGGAITAQLSLRGTQVRGRILESLQRLLAEGEVRLGERVEVDPWRLAVTVEDLAIRAVDGDELLRVRRLGVRPSLGALLLGRFEPREVVLDGPHLKLVRGPDGSFTIGKLLAPSPASESAALVHWPRVRLRGGRLTIRSAPAADPGRSAPAADPGPSAPGVNPGSSPRERPPSQDLVLEDISLSATSRRGLFSFRAEVRHAMARRLMASGTWDQEAKVLECSLKGLKVDLGGPIDPLLGRELAADVRRLRLGGFVDMEGKLRWDAGRFEVLEASGKFIRCGFTPPRLAMPLRDLGARFALRGKTLELRDIQGRLGDGRVTGEATLELDSGAGLRAFDLHARAGGLLLDRRLRAELPTALQRAFDEIQPQGNLGLDVRVRRPRPAAPLEVTAVAALEGVDFGMRRFPYRFYDLRGEAVYHLRREGGVDRQRLEITRPLTARNRGVALTITGRADLPSPGSAGGAAAPAGAPAPEGPAGLAIEARVDNLPLDEELREALGADAREFWDIFQPSGQAQLIVSVRHGKDRPEPELAAFVQCQGVRISYRHFPYELTDITGRLQLDVGLVSGKSRLTLADLHGQHGGQPITGLGVVEWGQREMYRIDLACDDLRMDPDLRSALPPSVQKLLDDFRFQGRARTAVTIHAASGGEPEVKVELDLLEGHVAYVLFPYPLTLTGGHFTAIGDHTVRFSNVVTPERDAQGAPQRPRVVFNGGIGLVWPERLLDFRFEVEELDLDDRLRSVLPGELRRFVENIGLEGTFRGEVSGTFFDPMEAPPGGPPPGAEGARPGRLVYEARRVEARDAAVDFGIRLRRIAGQGEFVGGRDEKGNHYFDGRVRGERAAFNRLQLGPSEISFSFGKEHPTLAALREKRPLPEGEFRPSTELTRDLQPDRLSDTFQMHVHRSDFYGGNVRGFMAIDVGKRHDFAAEFVAEGIQVAKAAPDAFRGGRTDATGEARGKTSFRGTTGDSLSITGSGEGFIERARLVQVPLFVSMLNVLLGNFSGRSHFHEAVARFTIREGKFRAPAPEGLVLRSQGMDLKGGGTMDFDGRLNLSFTPMLLRRKIPVLDQVFGLLKKGLAQVWVTGDLGNPRVRFVTGAGLLRVPIQAGGPVESDRPLPRELREAQEPGPPPETKR